MRIESKVGDETLTQADAMNMVQTAANEYFPPAEYLLGRISQNDLLGQTGKQTQSVKYYERAALRGHKDASFKLGSIYLNGSYGVKTDTNKAKKLLAIAAKEERGVVDYDYTPQFMDIAKKNLDDIAQKEKYEREMKKKIEESAKREEMSEETPEKPEETPEEDDDIYIVAADEAARFLEGKNDEYGGEIGIVGDTESKPKEEHGVKVVDIPISHLSPSESIDVDNILLETDNKEEAPARPITPVIAAAATAAAAATIIPPEIIDVSVDFDT
jgi:hypothetical protein